jgi:glycosyltransferase involved in cell wall biosynthesis
MAADQAPNPTPPGPRRPRAERPLRSVSVLMPTWQGAEFLGRCLAALARQRLDLDWDFLAVDSGSTDGTLELLERARAGFPVPLEVESIHQAEFDHGDTRNWLAARSRGDLLVFLTQDAIPVGDQWLARVVSAFDDPTVGAAYCRNLPRPDCHPLTAILSAGDPGYRLGGEVVELPPPERYERLSPDERRLLCNFNDVASALRRELWERHPFPRTAFGEDVLLARALLEAGYRVAYLADAPVEHSHDYDVAQTRARARIDGRFNAEWLGRICIASEKDAHSLARRLAPADARDIAAAGFSGERARELQRELHARREAAFLGLWEGGRSQRRRPATGLLRQRALHVLFVVHGFPPETWAGTEVYTLTLAQALLARGHQVTVLARCGAERAVADGGPPDFSLREETFEGLRVLRLVHRLEHRSLRESYHQPRAEAAFRQVLLEVRPDLVHFQHLIHLSAGLVHVAREFGLPTVVHCHDYWALCARVQLIRPDGERCEENMGAGCLLCVKERHLDQIPRFKRLGQVLGPVLDRFGEGQGRGLLGDRARRRWEGYTDLRARQEFVLGAYAAADLLVSPSRFLREKLLASGAFAADRFVYSDNGLRTDHVRALRKRPDSGGRLRFGFVGSLVWYKGGETLVRAMARLAGRGAVLHVHGAFDPERDPHHRALRDLAGPNVVFQGRFDNSRLSEVYAELDVLVVPSTWFENSPITIHEAFLTHTPVVCSDIGGMAEYVRDGVDGLHFRTGDADHLARVLARFLDEPDLLAQLSRSWMRVKTIEENAAETEYRYRALLAERRARVSATVLERAGFAADRRLGPVERQGADLALLRPGGAALEFDLPVRRAGAHRVRIEVLALGGESAVELGGRVLVDGHELGRLAPFRAAAQDELRAFEFAAELAPGARLRLESALAAGGPEVYLRVASLTVREDVEAEVPAEVQR